MNKLIRKSFIILLILMLTIIFIPINSKAALQSNKDTQYNLTQVTTAWLSQFRDMEKTRRSFRT